MNFDFSEEQKFLREQARKFLATACPTTLHHAILDHGTKIHDPTLWQAIAAQGWLGAAIPEEYGGLGLGYLELCVIAEELGRAVAPVPFASTAYLLAEALLLAGSEAQKHDLLPRIAAGEVIGCLAINERPGHYDATPVEAIVRNGRLSGVKIPVTDGNLAGVALVLATDGGQPALFLVDLTGPGVTRESVATVDPTRDVAKLSFADAPTDRLGERREIPGLLDTLLDRAAVLIAFEQVGGADRALEMARDYALQRYAFGRQIGSYQAIKHKLADIYIKNELGRANAYYAAWALNAGAAELPVAAAAARIAASDAFWFAAKENIQTHGGIGFTWEMDCHLYYRRARQLGVVVGGAAVWKERLVSQLELRNAA